MRTETRGCMGYCRNASELSLISKSERFKTLTGSCSCIVPMSSKKDNYTSCTPHLIINLQTFFFKVAIDDMHEEVAVDHSCRLLLLKLICLKYEP
jgi:hypothetical protein